MVLMSLTFAALVEALGTTSEVDKAIEMVEEISYVAGVAHLSSN